MGTETVGEGIGTKIVVEAVGAGGGAAKRKGAAKGKKGTTGILVKGVGVAEAIRVEVTASGSVEIVATWEGTADGMTTEDGAAD
jgi:hypothetical protein